MFSPHDWYNFNVINPGSCAHPRFLESFCKELKLEIKRRKGIKQLIGKVFKQNSYGSLITKNQVSKDIQFYQSLISLSNF